MSYLKISLGIFIALAASRFLPHPPNFTSLLALSFYVPAILGIRYMPALLVSFVITDIFIGFHTLTLFTWGTVILIGLNAKTFSATIMTRITGALLSACIFFLITNFGVWSLGTYGYNLEGFIMCYFLALPFFGYTIISTMVFSVLIEGLIRINLFKISEIKKS